MLQHKNLEADHLPLVPPGVGHQSVLAQGQEGAIGGTDRHPLQCDVGRAGAGGAAAAPTRRPACSREATRQQT